jgi:hypothetical protein
MGEITVVASAKRAVRGLLRSEVEEEEEDDLDEVRKIELGC